MSQRKRMYRTLGALAGAMTSTAALLAYFDPASTLGPQPLSSDELAQHARAAVADRVAIDARRWRQVELVAGESASTAGTALIATANLGDAHFYVDALGRPSRGALWNRQLPSAEAPDTVRIEVALQRGDEALSSAQQTAVAALVSELDQHVVGLALP